MNKRYGDFRPKFAPVKVGDELDVTIDAVGEKGDGIAKVEGFVLFVPNAEKGKEVKIKVTRVLRNVGFAEVIGKSEAKDKEQTEESEELQQPEEESTAEDSEREIEDTEDFGEEENKDY